ncbi:MAG: DUF1223 domain-containing protein [Mesorhizobium sp.]
MVAAGDRPLGVVELFTSQGCNSCPPADDNLAAIARRGDVVTLAYHVNYWDYRGWRDTLASAENTARQQEYRNAFRARAVYTPQAVINGRVHVNGAKRHAVEGALASLSSNGKGMQVEVHIERRKDSFVISIGDAPKPISAQVKLVYFDHPQSVTIGEGENDGRTVYYVNPVTGSQPAGMWHGKASTIELPANEVLKKGAGGCAILLQSVTADGGPGPIIGAASLKNAGAFH